MHDSIYSFLHIYDRHANKGFCPCLRETSFEYTSCLILSTHNHYTRGDSNPSGHWVGGYLFIMATTLGPTRCQASYTKQPPVCHGPQKPTN